MLSSVSYHAVLRYLERVLGLPVDAWTAGMAGKNDLQKALHCCGCAGLPVDAIKQSILVPPVIRAMQSKLPNVTVRHDGFAYIVGYGTVRTILTGEMRPKHCRHSRKWSRRDLRKLAESAE